MYINRATWRRINQSECYLRTKDSDLFLKETNNIEEYEQKILSELKSPTKGKVKLC